MGGVRQSNMGDYSFSISGGNQKNVGKGENKLGWFGSLSYKNESELYQNAENNENKERQMKSFILASKSHINVLSKKNYSKLLNINSPNYIFMFMPHEFAIVHAQKYDSSILQYAQQKQIIIVGPSTLIMCMKLVESIWKIENQNKNSKEIAKVAGSMIDQIAKTINLINETSKNLDKSMKNIEDTKKFIKDGNQSLYNKANKMRELGAENKIKIDSK